MSGNFRVLVAVRPTLVREAVHDYLRVNAPDIDVVSIEQLQNHDFDPANPWSVLRALNRSGAQLLIYDWCGSSKDRGMSSHLFARFPRLRILCLLPDNRMRMMRADGKGDTCATSLPGMVREIRREFCAAHRPPVLGFVGNFAYN